MKAIAWRYTTQGHAMYVATVPGPGGKWEFTPKRERALPLSPYWQRRFEQHCAREAVAALFATLNKKREVA